MSIAMIYRLMLLLAAATLVTACGKKDAPVTVDESTATTLEESADASVAETTEPDEDETQEVVEESAAVGEDTGDEEIVLARADTDTAAPTVNYKYKEGTHYQRLVPSQPTIGAADKIEVAEFFWYGCQHCYSFEPTINRWDAEKPANVRFVRVPAMWNEVLVLHAKLFYTEEVLVRNGVIKDAEGFRSAVFDEYHNRNNRLLTEPTIKRLFARFGVSEQDFDKTWNSFEVSQKMRVAADLSKRYSISSVPAIIVNGKYRTGGAEAGGYPALIEVIDELVARESAR